MPWLSEQPNRQDEEEEEDEDGVVPPPGEAGEEIYGRPQPLEFDLDFDLAELMVPSEAKQVFVSQDLKEVHYIVPVQRARNYHKNYRDFVVVGYRLLRCSNSEQANQGSPNEVFVGWCSAERTCREPPFRRAVFPGSEMDFSADITTGFGPFCDCAKRLYDHLGRHECLRMELQIRDTTIHYPADGAPRHIDGWIVARHEYDIVQLNQPHDLIFNQWGVSKLTNEGHYSCKMCTSQPRHCAHNKALLGVNDGEGTTLTGNGLSHKETADMSISRLLDADKALKPPCISRLQLPFFPEEDAVVDKHCKGNYDLLPFACIIPVITGHLYTPVLTGLLRFWFPLQISGRIPSAFLSLSVQTRCAARTTHNIRPSRNTS